MSITTGPNFADLQQRHELDVYGKRGITLVRGEGAKVWDDQGRSYLDCIGGHGTAALGHGHPRVLKTMEEQARKLISCPGMFFNDERALYMDRLVSVAPEGLNKVFFCNSGTEAVEAALKFARIHTGRSGFIAAKQGFHGRTFGAMSATFNRKYAEGSSPLVPGFTHVPFNDASALREAFRSEPAGVILEIIQGEGGVILGRDSFFKEARKLCDQYGALLIVDEVQTGFCRTGRLFACEHFDLAPDLLCLAKTIAAGLPMGAVLAREWIEVPKGRHGSTFGGNPLCCAVARTTLEVMLEDDLAREAERKGDHLAGRLRESPPSCVREVRYKGLMFGIELKIRVKPILKSLMESGVLTLSSGSTVLRLLPPLVIEGDQIDQVAERLIEVLNRAATD